MWREPGFSTRNLQARMAKGFIKAPEPGDTTMFRPLKAGFSMDDPVVKAYPAREMRLFAKGPNLQQLPKLVPFGPVPVPAMDRCPCPMCQGERLTTTTTTPRPALSPATALDEAKATASKLGEINQAMHDAFNMIPGRVKSYNDGRGQPWMAELTDYMRSNGWTLAGGGYFSVVFTKGELAIKLGTKAEDSGAAYAAWARDNQGLAGVPVIHHIERYGRQSYTVLMPRYAEVNDNDTARAVSGGRMGAVSETYEKIAAFFKGVATMDLHGDNIMRDRLTGEIIITDPVSFKAWARN